jgi:hypothetical protein
VARSDIKLGFEGGALLDHFGQQVRLLGLSQDLDLVKGFSFSPLICLRVLK